MMKGLVFRSKSSGTIRSRSQDQLKGKFNTYNLKEIKIDLKEAKVEAQEMQGSCNRFPKSQPRKILGRDILHQPF